jgi:hypothetical protein
VVTALGDLIVCFPLSNAAACLRETFYIPRCRLTFNIPLRNSIVAQQGTITPRAVSASKEPQMRKKATFLPAQSRRVKDAPCPRQGRSEVHSAKHMSLTPVDAGETVSRQCLTRTLPADFSASC